MSTYFGVLFVVLGFGYVIAFTRTGKVTAAMPGRKREIHSPASPDQAFAAICTIGQPYKVDDKDAARHLVMVSSPVTFFSWGFLYLVVIAPEGTGSRITIGCASKFFQMGPLVTKAHDNCVAAIEGTLTVPTARVA
jgi:hypothetical protein